MIDGSLVIISIVIFEMNGWLIETTILIQYHCKNGNEKQYNQAGKIDILIIMESCIVIKNRFETNNQSFHRNVPNQWIITVKILIIIIIKISIRIIIIIIIIIIIRNTTDFHQISENGRNIYEWNQIKQASNTRNWFRSNILEWIR